MNGENGLTGVELEQFYEVLAAAIDEVGAPHEGVFLTKLALLLGQRIGALAPVLEAIDAAKADL